MWRFLNEYFEASSVHGFAYVHYKNHWIFRIIWLTIIVTGFLTSGFVIKSAFEEWSDNPVVTTMDSIAAPITNLQLPTVTLCNDEGKIPESWAFLETVLNFASFKCKEGGYDQCHTTKDIREELKFLVEPIAKDFKGWFFQNKKNITNAPVLDWQLCHSGEAEDTDQFNERCPVILWKNYLAEMMKQRKLSDRDLYDLAMKSFGRMDRELGDLIEKEIGIELPEFQEEDPYCKSKKCQSNIRRLNVYLQLIYLIKDGQAPDLGTALKSLTSMDRTSTHDEFPSFKASNFYNEEFSCDEGNYRLKNNELWLHQYFTNLSKTAGFEDEELVSLYDVPGMVSTLTKLQREYLYGPQNFIYSRCTNDVHFELRNVIECFNKWRASLDNTGVHPCDDVAHKKKCCHFWSGKLGNNLEAIMKVMRFAVGRGRSKLLIDEFMEQIMENLHYPVKNFTELEVLDHQTLIPWCDLNDQKISSKLAIDSCNLFEPVITDMGLCHSFNPTPVSKLLAPSYFKEAFLEAFKSDLNPNSTILMGTGSGTSQALDFFVLTKSNLQSKESNRMWMGLSTHNGYFDMKSVSQPIKPGYQTTWKVQAMEIWPSQDLHDIPIDKRKCRFEDEAENLILFDHYSQEACEFEKHVLEAEEYCRCVPWYIPSKIKSEKHTICDVYGNYCFSEKMKDGHSDTHEEDICLPSCHQLQFTFSKEMEKRDPEDICNTEIVDDGTYPGFRNKDFEPDLARTLYKHEFSELMYKYNATKAWINGKSNNISELKLIDSNGIMRDLCKSLVKDRLAKVSVFYEKKKYVKTLTNKRVTLTDKLGTFGGTLGLFTGMSFLSMVEIVHWILKFMSKISFLGLKK